MPLTLTNCSLRCTKAVPGTVNCEPGVTGRHHVVSFRKCLNNWLLLRHVSDEQMRLWEGTHCWMFKYSGTMQEKGYKIKDIYIGETLAVGHCSYRSLGLHPKKKKINPRHKQQGRAKKHSKWGPVPTSNYSTDPNSSFSWPHTRPRAMGKSSILLYNRKQKYYLITQLALGWVSTRLNIPDWLHLHEGKKVIYFPFNVLHIVCKVSQVCCTHTLKASGKKSDFTS